MKRKRNYWYENLPMIDKLPIWYGLEENLNDLKLNIGIDKLKICYSVDNDMIINELESGNLEFYSFYDFDLRRIDGKYHSDIYQILIPTFDKDNEVKTVVFGELRWNLKAESNESDSDTPKEKKVWLYVDNKMFYSDGCEMYALEFIAEELGLRLRNITELEIYIDSTKKNLSNLLKRMIRNENYTVFLNEKEVKDRLEDRKEIVYTHTGDMNKYKYLTINIFSLRALRNKVDGISICAYNKFLECMQKGKRYVLDKYEGTSRLHRIEIRVGNEKFKEFCNINKIELEEFIFRDKGFLFSAFEWFFEKVIYFRDENKEKITIADIVL